MVSSAEVYLNIKNKIATLHLDRPAMKNAIGSNFLSLFSKAIATVRNDPNVRVMIIKSNVKGVFCAGADLKERLTMTRPQVDEFVFNIRSNFTQLSNLPIPTISVIDGVALGGGLEMALSTDFRIAGSDASVGLTETKLAIIPGAGGTQRLPRLIGVTKAKELIFTGRRLSSNQALAIGLVDYAVAGSGYDKAVELAEEILPQGPIALRMAKLAIDKGSELDISSGMALEQACYGNIISTKDRLEGLNAFKEKRTPIYKGE